MSWLTVFLLFNLSFYIKKVCIFKNHLIIDHPLHVLVKVENKVGPEHSVNPQF